jgi:CheY-like chemotaxis protein
MLEHWKMRPVLAASAAEAMQRLQEAKHAGSRLDLALVDANMPEVDGFALVGQFGKPADLGGLTVIMADLGGTAGRCTSMPRTGGSPLI